VSAPDRGPDALLPVWAARLLGFAALGSLAALEWQRLVEGLSAGRALLWVAVAVGAGAAVLACDRLPARSSGVATIAVAAVGLLAAVVVSGLDLEYLKPRRWDDLVEGVAAGTQSLGTVRLPYAGADPWPRAALELFGSGLLTCAALLACLPLGERGRGYPFVALGVLLVLVASPVVSLGGTRPLVLGVVLAALTVCFLWLERLPLRPGIGVAALLAVALAGALPLAAVADRGEPWFDYRAFAEGLGPDDPVRFSWNQEYGPIDWPRDGNEVMRIKSEDPHYWKAADLDEFDGRGWRRGVPDGGSDFRTEVRPDWWNAPGWQERIEVSVRRLRTRDVIAPGTVMEVSQATRPVLPSGDPGRWQSGTELRRGDSYTVQAYVPEPSVEEVRRAAVSGYQDVRTEQLRITAPFAPGRRPIARELGGVDDREISSAVVHFRPFGDGRPPYAQFPEIQRSSSDGNWVLERSAYRRTWRLAQRLRAGAKTPFEYILRVNAHLADGFGYSERPQPPAPGRAPLDAFLIDTQEGYCQHFSGAMALLLRMGGVPARVATGFSPGGFSDRRDAWIVRDTDAHAWVEVWFQDVGWVTFDPTPSSTPARSQIAALEAPTAAGPASDPSAGEEEGGAAGTPRQGGGLRPDLRFDNDPVFSDDVAAAGGGGAGVWPWLLGGLVLVLIAGSIVWRRRRRAAGPQSPLDRAIAELEAALRRSGRPAPPGTTLRQLEHRLGGSPDAGAYLRALSAGRYGPAPVLPTPAERRALRRALAQGLGPLGRLRALWALPPRPR
jgi:transglutaminase-like putative cysteine protease